MSLPARPTGPQRFALQVAVLLIVLSFQINVVFAGALVSYALVYAILLACFVAVVKGRLTWTKIYIVLTLMVVSALAGQPLKGLGLGIGTCLGYIAIKEYESDFERIMTVVLVVNFVLVALQFFGVSESVYHFQSYANAAPYRSVFEDGFGLPSFLPQIRPAGIFPAVTYVSAYSVLLFTHLASVSNTKSKIPFILAGLLFALLGSTLGLMLVCAAAVLMFGHPGLRYLVLAYAIALAVYAYYMPLQFLYNFGFDDIEKSVMARADLSNTAGESVAQGNFPMFVVLCVVGAIGGIVALSAKRLKHVIGLIPFGIAVMLPALVHDISFSMFYWFLLGVSFARLPADVLRRRQRKPAARSPLSLGPSLQAQ